MQKEEVLVRYLSDSLRMVEEAMRGGAPARTSSLQRPAQGGAAATAQQQRQAAAANAMPARRATSDVMVPPAHDARYSSTTYARRQARDAELQNKLRHSMQAALPSSSAPAAGATAAAAMGGRQQPHARWSSTGRGLGGADEYHMPAAGRQPQQQQQYVHTSTQAAAARQQAPATGGGGGHSRAGGAAPAQQSAAQPWPRRNEGGGRPPIAPQQSQQQQYQQQYHQQQAGSLRRGPSSDAGSNADWWRPPSSSSVVSYPMTAITDRAGSVASTEFRAWMERINQLESAVKDERSKRRQFENEMKKMYAGSDALFGVSRGDLATGGGAGAQGAPPAGAIGKPR